MTMGRDKDPDAGQNATSLLPDQAELALNRKADQPESDPGTPPLPEIVESPWVPSPRLIDQSWMTISDWKKRVSKIRTTPGREKSRVVFIGDSITEGWTDVAPLVWETAFKEYLPLSLGIGGDQTQNVLWRMDQGELIGIDPKVVVLLIGVNNIWWGGFTPAETARGISTVVARTHQDLPAAHIIVHGLFPAGRRPDDELRVRIHTTNSLIKTRLIGQKSVSFLDIGQIFLEHDGSIDQAIMHDFLHLTEKGYARWAVALRDPLREKIS
jgi:lysophospholipase L1-like esterase